MTIAKERMLGLVAYLTYYGARKGLTHDNRPMPHWRELGQPIQDAWITAAVAATMADREIYDAVAPDANGEICCG